MDPPPFLLFIWLLAVVCVEQHGLKVVAALLPALGDRVGDFQKLAQRSHLALLFTRIVPFLPDHKINFV